MAPKRTTRKPAKAAKPAKSRSKSADIKPKQPLKKAKAPSSPAKRTEKLKSVGAGTAKRAIAKSMPKPTPKAKTSRKPARTSSPYREVVAPRPTPRKAPPVAPANRPRGKKFDSALQGYEAAIRLMHDEAYDKARSALLELIRDYGDEAEVAGRARMMLNACEKRLRDRKRVVLKTAEDFYDIAVSELNRRDLDAAIGHFEQAARLAPKGDHVQFGLAAAFCLKGEKDRALASLKSAIHLRPENRFMAAKDADFLSLAEDTDFQKLLQTGS